MWIWSWISYFYIYTIKLENITLSWTDINNQEILALSFEKERGREIAIKLLNNYNCNVNFIQDDDDDEFPIPDPHPDTLEDIYNMLMNLSVQQKEYVYDLIADDVFIIYFIEWIVFTSIN